MEVFLTFENFKKDEIKHINEYIIHKKHQENLIKVKTIM